MSDIPPPTSTNAADRFAQDMLRAAEVHERVRAASRPQADADRRARER